MAKLSDKMLNGADDYQRRVTGVLTKDMLFALQARKNEELPDGGARRKCMRTMVVRIFGGKTLFFEGIVIRPNKRIGCPFDQADISNMGVASTLLN